MKVKKLTEKISLLEKKAVKGSKVAQHELAFEHHKNHEKTINHWYSGANCTVSYFY